MSCDPPEQTDIVNLRSLNVDSIRGYWEVYDESMGLVDRGGYACAETDTIRGCIEITIRDHVPIGEPFMRSAVISMEEAYTVPDPDAEDGCSFIGVAPGFYTVATNEPGQNMMTLCGPFMGINGSVFWHSQLLVGQYANYLTAGVHFLLNIWNTFPWTLGAVIDVVSCLEENQPQLLTIPMPPNPKGGDLIHDTAQLIGGKQPGGSINFKLWADPEETLLIFEQNVDIDGNGTYETEEVELPEDIPWPEGLHWHWHAHYSGDGNNNEADSGAEPVDVAPEFGSPSGSDNFTIIDTATISGDHPGKYPLIALYQQVDLAQQWVIRTDTDVKIALEAEDALPVGPSLANHVCINGPRHWSEIMNQAGAHVYEIPLVDEIAQPVPLVMGSTYRLSNSDLYVCGTHFIGMPYSPYDICSFPDDSGILAAIVVGPGVLEFRKYSYDGATVLDKWTMGDDGVQVEPGWFLQPVKISITCDSSTVFYTFSNNQVKRYNLDTRTQLSNYLTLPAYVGYLYGDLQCIKGADDRVGVVLAMTESGQGPHRGLAVGPSNTVIVDKARPADGIYKVQWRSLGSLHLLHEHYFSADDANNNDQILGLCCNFDGCIGVSGVIAEVIFVG